MLRLALRLLGAELRRGDLRLLCLSLLLAVCAVTSVLFFTERVRAALTQEAHQLLGADLLLAGDRPASEAVAAAAQAAGLRLARTRSFPSMVLANDQAQLADVKAVSAGYPLRGQLVIRPQPGTSGQAVDYGPSPGEVWVDERLLAALAAQPGDLVQLGRQTLRIAAVLTYEPDRAVNFLGLAPRLMMHLDDLPASGLDQPGARISERLLLAGEPEAVARFRDWLTPQLTRGERLEDARSARPETRRALDQAERFLGLAAVLTVILAAVAVALTARRYVSRHLDACAVLRCLGLTQGRLLGLHGLQFLGLALGVGLLGSGLGFALHFVLIAWLGDLVRVDLPPAGPLPWAVGLGVALLLLAGFILPPLQQLARVPTLRVLRRELGPPTAGRWLSHCLGGLALAGLLVLVAGDWRLGGWLVLGFGLALLVIGGLIRLVLHGLGAWLPRLAGHGEVAFGWRLGWGNLHRHAGSVTLQSLALSLGLLALILLTVTRGQLLAAWEQKLPAGAPNRFVINLQPDQRAAFADWLASRGIPAAAAPLAPMVRGRLVAIGGRPVSAADYPEDERAQRLVEREFNLSWRDDLPPGNRLSAGSWFPAGSAGQGLASVEAGLAKTLGIRLGDSLTFNIAGQTQTATVSSLRQLDWDSMRVNFFVLFPSGVLDPVNASYITSFHLPAGDQDFAAALARDFPNLTMIDIGALLEQLRRVMDQVTAAVQFVFSLSLLAGLLVLQASLLGGLDERRQAIAVLRALGATRRPLRWALGLELAVVGALAGLFAALGALAIGELLAQRVFELELHASFGLLPLAMLGGAALSAGIGWLGVRPLLNTPAVDALRQA